MKTLVLGASNNPSRYSYMVTERLLHKGHEVVLFSNKRGEIFGQKFTNDIEHVLNIDTVTMYLSERNQEQYEDFLLELKPRRVIFNPGAENSALMQKLNKNGSEAFEACTLVMLGSSQF
jgi:uncharacterized protein